MNPLFKFMIGAHVFLYRSSGGRIASTIGGHKLVLLTTMGRKSGLSRTVPVVPFRDGERIFVMASMNGAPVHPAWFFNLTANPSVGVQLGTDHWRARARILEGEERASVWDRVTKQMPNFASYQHKTDRVIPVVELERVS